MIINLEKYVPEINRIASKMYKQFGGASQGTWDAQDLSQEGHAGLIEARANYDETKGPFKPYGFTRARGRMINFLRKRKIITIPRAKARLLNNFNHTYYHLFMKKGQEPSLEDIAGFWEIPVEDIRTVQGACCVNIDSIENIPIESEVVDPLVRVIKNDIRSKMVDDLEECLNRLPPKIRLAVKLSLIRDEAVCGLVLKHGSQDSWPRKSVSNGQLAKSLQMTPDSLRGYKSRGKRDLKECMDSKDWNISSFSLD